MTNDDLDRLLAKPLDGSAEDADAFVTGVMRRVAAVDQRRGRLLGGAALVGASVAVVGLGATAPGLGLAFEIADVVGAVVLAGACALVWITGGAWPALPASAQASTRGGQQ